MFFVEKDGGSIPEEGESSVSIVSSGVAERCGIPVKHGMFCVRAGCAQ